MMNERRPKPTAAKKQERLSAGVIPVFRHPGEPDRVLLLRCFNYWDFPKGLVHPGELPLDAAVRELQEETALQEVSFDWGTDYVETPVYAQGKVARYYLGRVNRKDVTLSINPEIGRPEHHEFRWVTLPEASVLLQSRVQTVLAWARGRISSVPE